MSDMSHRSEELARRVQRLEVVNRALLVLVAAALVVPWVGPRGDSVGTEGLEGDAAAAVSDVVSARRFQLVDDAGRVRIDLRHDDSETGLFIIDDQGDTRLGAAQFAHGGGGYALHGPGGRGAAVLYLRGEGSLTMYADDGAVLSRFPEGR